MSRETFTKAVLSNKVTPSQINRMTGGGSLGGSIGNIFTKGGTVTVKGFTGGALTAKQVKALPLSPLTKSKQAINVKAAAAAPKNTAMKGTGGTGFNFAGAALAVGDLALDVSPVGMGMGILTDVGNLAGLSLNALGIGGKKKAGGKGTHRHGASYWRNKYEAMYWKAKYESARYGHGRIK